MRAQLLKQIGWRTAIPLALSVNLSLFGADPGKLYNQGTQELRENKFRQAEAALQEDVDAIGLSILSGAHLTLLPKVIAELRARGLDDVVLWAGGIIPAEDVAKLRELGVAAVFGPGSPTGETVDFLRQTLGERSHPSSQ